MARFQLKGNAMPRNLPPNQLPSGEGPAEGDGTQRAKAAQDPAPQKAKPSSDGFPRNAASGDPKALLARLEVLASSGKVSKEELFQIIQDLKQAWSEKGTPPGDSIQLTGNAGPGATVGSGKTVNRDVAGRDIVHNANEIRSEVYLHIDNVDNLKVNGTERVVKESPLPDAPPTVDEVERFYLARLARMASRVPLGQLELQAAKPNQRVPEIRLERVYVPLDTTMTQPAVGEKRGTPVLVPALDAVIRNRRLVVLGDPGSGKTTLINYLTLSLAEARLHPERNILERLNVAPQEGQRATKWRYGALLPVRVDLREFVLGLPEKSRKGNAGMIWSHMAHKLEDQDLADFAPRLKEALCQGNCLVMFDGLDEVSDKARRKLVREAVTDFANAYDDNRYIVTCRVLSYTDPAWQLTSFPDVTLAPLSQHCIDTFIGNWYNTLAYLGYLEPRAARDKAAELRSAVRATGDLPHNPMLLTVMALVHTYKGTLPKERARLYDDCVNLLLWEWQRAKHTGDDQWEPGILEELDTREERLINSLCEVAFHAHRTQGAQANTANIPKKDLLNILKDYLDNDWGKAQRFCDYVEQRAGLLIGKGEDNSREQIYAFPHRGFQEFLAGRHIVAGRHIDTGWDFARRVADLVVEGDIWHEVLLLATGHLVFNLQEVTRPLDAISLLCKHESPTDDSGWRAVWWAGEMLNVVGVPAAEQDKHTGQELVQRVIKRLTQLAQEGHLTPRERAQAADILGSLGDPRPGVCTRYPELRLIQGGRFAMGEDQDRHSVKVEPFYLARYPVTNYQFRLFAEGDYNNDAYWTPAGIEWRMRTGQRRGLIYDPVWGIDNRPVVGVTWHEAIAYTRWLSKQTGKAFRLPSEAEWELAALGPEGRKYPWGSRTRDDTANIRDAGVGQTTAVGIFPEDKTPEEIYDLGGNVWEWCSSLGLDYPYKAGDGRENLEAAGPRIVRGGTYDSPRRVLHGTQRRPVDPQARVSLIGFRVAMNT